LIRLNRNWPGATELRKISSLTSFCPTCNWPQKRSRGDWQANFHIDSKGNNNNDLFANNAAHNLLLFALVDGGASANFHLNTRIFAAISLIVERLAKMGAVIKAIAAFNQDLLAVVCGPSCAASDSPWNFASTAAIGCTCGDFAASWKMVERLAISIAISGKGCNY